MASCSTDLEVNNEKSNVEPADGEISVDLRDESLNLKDNSKSESEVDATGSKSDTNCALHKPREESEVEADATVCVSTSECVKMHSSHEYQRRGSASFQYPVAGGDAEYECIEENGVFFIDTSGGGDTGPTPLYDCLNLSDDSVPETEKDSCPGMECFNCGGNHHLNACTKEIDRGRVSRNRREATKNINMKTTRYHIDEGQRENFKPGHLSNEMRRALDIGEGELPPFIYRMRVLGYPPGWLMEAAIESSGLKIYGSDGKVVEDENIEDGEINPTEKHVQYDPSKLIRFPGFNVPTPPGVYDECVRYDMPPMQPHQQLSEAAKYMKAPEPTPFKKRKKLPLTTPCKKSEVAVEVDMELDTDMDPSINGNVIEESLPSPNQPVADANTAPTTPNSMMESSSDTTDKHQPKEMSLLKEDSVPGQESEDTANTPEPKRNGKTICQSQGVILGTPIISGFSAYTCLPPRENFAKGISEHVPFENLPGATGRYDKLRGVLTKVRKAMSDDQKEDTS